MLRSAIPWVALGLIFYFGDGTVVEIGLSVVLAAVAAYSVAITLVRGFVARRFFRDHFIETRPLLRITGDLFLKQRTILYANANFLFVFVGLPYLVIALVLDINWWAIPAVLGAFLVNVGWRQLAPPVAVFLSASGREQVELCAEFQNRVFPLRVLNMLSDEAVTELGRRSPSFIAVLDGYRLVASEGWEDEIRRAIRHIPVIVMDLRAPSAALATEIAMVNEERLQWKVIAVQEWGDDVDTLRQAFFGGEDRRFPEVACLRPEELCRTFIHWIVVRLTLPQETIPAGSYMEPPPYEYADWKLFHRAPEPVVSW